MDNRSQRAADRRRRSTTAPREHRSWAARATCCSRAERLSGAEGAGAERSSTDLTVLATHSARPPPARRPVLDALRRPARQRPRTTTSSTTPTAARRRHGADDQHRPRHRRPAAAWPRQQRNGNGNGNGPATGPGAGRRQRRRLERRGRVMSVTDVLIAGRYRARAPPRRRAACRPSSSPSTSRLERHVAVKLLAEHLADGPRVRLALPARGALRGAAGPPEHRAGLRLGPRRAPRPALHRHGVRRRAVRRRDPARARRLDLDERARRRRPAPAPGSTTPTATASSIAT